MEKKYGYTLFKDMDLYQLAEKFEKDREWEDAQMQIADFIPCDCWT